MQVAQILAGYSLGEADLLRRAMGKKIRRRDGGAARALRRGRGRARHRARAGRRDLRPAAKFAEYGFNKSHAAAYALVAYQTAYLKANYPVEFLAASMTLDMGNTDKLSEFRAEAERLGIKVEPPSVNRSGVAFDVRGQHDLLRARRAEGRRRGRRSSRSSRRAATSRSATSPISPRRINPRAVNKRVLESLAAAGAFDALEPDRARAHRRASTPCWRPRSARHEAATRRPERHCSAAPASRETLPIPRGRAMARRPSGCSANTTPSASSCPAIRSTITPALLKRLQVQSLDGVRPLGEGRRHARAASPRPWCRARSGAPRPATRWASSACPIRPAITRR